jgi:hypothetical protein
MAVYRATRPLRGRRPSPYLGLLLPTACSCHTSHGVIPPGAGSLMGIGMQFVHTRKTKADAAYSPCQETGRSVDPHEPQASH